MIREFYGNTPGIAESTFASEAVYVVGSSEKLKDSPHSSNYVGYKRDLKDTLNWPLITKNKAYSPIVEGSPIKTGAKKQKGFDRQIKSIWTVTVRR